MEQFIFFVIYCLLVLVLPSIHVIKSSATKSEKITWILLFVLFQVLGVLFYLVYKFILKK
ncbi:PLDc N-terminal domain-containing protein [Thalassotalea piscium]